MSLSLPKNKQTRCGRKIFLVVTFYFFYVKAGFYEVVEIFRFIISEYELILNNF